MTAEHDARFSSFVAARGTALMRTAYLLTGNSRDAEDLLQDVLAKTYAAWPRIRSTDAAESYVRVALPRAAASWWRRRRREVVVADPPDHASSAVDSFTDRSEMWDHLRALPPRQRAVLVLRYYENLSEAEIAEALRCSTGTVKSQASKALANLRRRMPRTTTPSTAEETR